MLLQLLICIVYAELLKAAEHDIMRRTNKSYKSLNTHADISFK